MATVDYLLLGAVAGLAAVERKGFLQAMLSRPVALAPAVGLALGDLRAGLLLGPPLELLWLGAVNMGAALPANEALGAAAIVGSAVLAGRTLGTGVTPAVALLAVVACAPLALAGRRLDALVERWNERLAVRAEALLEQGHARGAMRENLYGLLLPFGAAALAAPAAAAVVGGLLPLVLRAAPAAEAPLAAGFWAFAGFACAAGARAVRGERSPRIFVAALAAGTLLGLCLLAWGWVA
ncbi:MAG TPA: PTS sugar transporter subunit IIC [Anaeromyxobacteraceae bacterium]|nr:PTS sugar transporter subunit IIC [Anaeromyxobacteraceae bacterium]